MKKVEQIGPSGLASLLLGFLLGSSLLVPMGGEARQDAWLALLLGAAASLPVAWVYMALARRFQGQSPIAYSRALLGPWLGGLVGLLYVWYSLHLGALVLRNVGEFVTTTILPATPMGASLLTLMLLCTYAVRHGLEPLTRTGQVLVGMTLTLMLLTLVLVAKEARPERLLPVLEHGPAPLLSAALTVLAFPFGEKVLFLMILPRLQRARDPGRPVLAAMLGAMLVLTIVHVFNVAVLGPHLMVSSLFPTLEMIRTIEVAEFLTRLDPLFVAVWVATGFIKIAVCMYVTVRALAEWAKVRDYRPLTLPIGAIMAVLSVLLFDNSSQLTTFFLTIWPVYSVPFQVLMPLLLLGLAWVRGVRGVCARA